MRNDLNAGFEKSCDILRASVAIRGEMLSEQRGNTVPKQNHLKHNLCSTRTIRRRDAFAELLHRAFFARRALVDGFSNSRIILPCAERGNLFYFLLSARR